MEKCIEDSVEEVTSKTRIFNVDEKNHVIKELSISEVNLLIEKDGIQTLFIMLESGK